MNQEGPPFAYFISNLGENEFDFLESDVNFNIYRMDTCLYEVFMEYYTFLMDIDSQYSVCVGVAP